ncbi:MAG: DEAD/DEAH box helicase [Cytophagales bacterium]|nr:DEAD/DEAH box helicase [Cytophagales bacterium]
MLRCLDDEGVEKTTPTDQLTVAQSQIQRASAARQNALTWLRWQWFSGERKALRQLAAANCLGLGREDLGVLGKKLQKRLALEKLAAEVRQAWPLENPYEETTVRLWFGQQRTARRAFKIARKLNAWPLLESLTQHTHNVFQEKIHQLLAIADEWQLVKTSWRLYLADTQIAESWQQPETVPGRIAALERDFDNLCELDGIKRRLSHAENEVVQRLLKHEAGTAENADWPRIFDNSLRLSWIEHIEAQHPVLRIVSTYKMRQAEDELQEAVRKKQQLSREMLLLKLREQTYRHITLNRLGNRTTYRDLQHQTAKKRHVWTLRKLLAHYADEIFQLIPCWLASPESVSAITPLPAFPKSPHPQPFPQGGREFFSSSPLGATETRVSGRDCAAGRGLFDLVIFDEASQCYAERGIPAMYRGAQVVITGDSQQLQPSDLYRVRYEEDTDDQPDLEVDSLLDLAARYLPQTQLRGHYRSQSLELIDFSNRHFYGQNLELLPDFRLVNRQEPAIAYLKVDGLWQNNQNRTEAETVVDLVWKLTAQQSDKEIGVVTFNFQQQTLIQDLLEASAAEQNRMLPPSLFVKNIENVQGDERDIIVFSLGYASDTAGRLVMQFGSLNQQGGENRLNVAVTRAREKIYLVSSLLPHQLRTDGTLHAGPKLLRQYLEYAWQVSAGEYVPQPRPVRDFASGHLLKDKVVTQPASLLPADENTLAVKELPFADVTVKHSGRYDSLVLTDDDLYYQSPSAKAAHAYTPMLLQAKNWRYKRIYSREWWKNRSEVRGQKSEM